MLNNCDNVLVVRVYPSPRKIYPMPLPPFRADNSKSGLDFKVVAIGSSAGGLDASTKLIDALPATSGMAFILVQHLDPHSPSMLAALLSSHTTMAVVEVKTAWRLSVIIFTSSRPAPISP